MTGPTIIGQVPSSALPPPDALDVLPEPMQSTAPATMSGPLHHRQYAPQLRPRTYVASWTVDRGTVAVWEEHYRRNVAKRAFPLVLRCGQPASRVRYAAGLTVTWISATTARVSTTLADAIP